MRIQNSLKNMLFGISGQVISAVMGFAVRSVFIYTLGIDYLGVEGLFSSILILLSLANLGFDTAMTFSLYKPLAEKDQDKIQGLIRLYKRAYHLIGIVVLALGLSLMPLLPFLMSGKTAIPNIEIIYLLFVVHSASSYFFSYKHTVIVSDQRNHIISKIHSVFTIVTNFVQIGLLLGTRYYLAVLVAQLAFRIMENVYIARKADRLYPYLRSSGPSQLTREDRRIFFENLYAQSLYKISAVVIIGTDNIVISAFIGLTAVGIYSNYLMIIGVLSTFISYLFHSITASVGNMIVNEHKHKKYFMFRVLQFANFWVYGFCAVCLWTLMNPFITLWLGDHYVLDKLVVFAILLNFYTGGMQDAPTTYRETSGLFRRGQYRPLIAAVINVAVSIVLAREIGIAGVLLGTVISRLCTYFWYDPYIVYKYLFDRPVKSYFVRYAGFVPVVMICAAGADGMALYLSNDPLIRLIIGGVCCLVIPNLVFYLFFHKSDEYQYLKNIIVQLAHGIQPRRSAKSRQFS